ncbi:MAG: monovalent cation/H(+) antiporter subunit G [Rickettsiaceae bacterium]|nr:monovalent cation/H(+) antiporter subunit G [Rickettsiaceae bacterium]
MIYIGWLLIFIGIFFLLSGLIAIYRLPGFYNKLHATGMIDCCGIPFCIIGLALMQDNYTSFFKLIFIGILIFIVSPLSTYGIANSSIKSKIDCEGRIK